MRRALLIVALCGAVLGIAVGESTAAPGSAATWASLRLVDTYPVTVRGTGFRPHERVTVVLRTGTRIVRATRAGAGGAFTLELGADVNACPGFSITATGNRGSRATLKRAPGKCPAP